MTASNLVGLLFDEFDDFLVQGRARFTELVNQLEELLHLLFHLLSSGHRDHQVLDPIEF